VADETIGRGIIEFQADTSGVASSVEAGAKAVERFEDRVQAAAAGAGAAMSGAAAQTSTATAQMDASTKRFLATLQRESDQAGRSRAEYLELAAAQKGVTAAAGPLIARIREQEQAAAKAGISFNRYGLSVKQTQAALRQVPAQLTDIFVGLQGGQNPLTVFLQQGGQLRDVFGGAVPAAKALGSAVLGLINPLTIAAAIIGTIAVAFKTAQDESFAFAKALAVSGNAAGTTRDQLSGMAAAIDEQVGTYGKAAEVLSMLASTGRVAGGDLQRFAQVAIQMERVTGQAVDETVKNFAELGKSPVEASKRLNETTRFLTSSVYEQIRSLEEQGRTVDAARVAQEAYANSAATKLAQLESQLGIFPRLWNNIAGAAKEAWDEILNVGRPEQAGEAIARLQRNLAALDAQSGLSPEFGGSSSASSAADRQAIIDQIALLQDGQRESKRYAEAEGERARANEAAVKAQDAVAKVMEQSATKTQKMNKELAEYRRNLDAIRKVDPNSATLDPAVIRRTEANIRAKYAEKAPKGEANAIRTAELAAAVAATKRELEAMTGAYKNAESILESVKQAGILSDKEYYDARRSLVALNSQAQLSGIDAEIAALEEGLAAKDLAKAKAIDIERQIADAYAKRALAAADASTKIVLLNAQEKSSAESLRKAYEEARIAAQLAFDEQNKQQMRALDLMGKGPVERDREAGRNQITDRYANERRQLEAQRRANQITKEAYDQQLAIIADFQAKSLASFDDYYDTLQRKNADWSVGAQEALSKYRDQAADVAGMTEDAFTRAFGGMEDALVELVSTGKANFGDLAKSIIADLIRIHIRALLVRAAMQFSGMLGFGGLPGGGSAGAGGVGFGGSFGGGFPMSTGTNYVPYDGFKATLHEGEAVVPKEYNPAAGGRPSGGGGNVYITNNTPSEVKAERRDNGDIEILIDRVESGITERTRRGGGLAPLMSGMYGLNMGANGRR
jgi:lambda family phage tail tape measure protein